VIEEKISLNVLDYELRRTLASGHGLDEATLEEVTQVACKYLAVREIVIDELKRQCRVPTEGFVHPPLPAYELLAHMVKHGLIDHIISFNFDEFLDESLLNELGPAHRRIISERDTLVSETLPQSVSCLIKPHGTISSSRSLRFTRDDVATFPDELATYLQDNILPSSATPTSDGRSIAATLLIIGFSMRDPAFNRILLESGIGRIYRIDTKVPDIQHQFAEGPLPSPVPEKLIVHPGGVAVLEDIWNSVEQVAADQGIAMPSAMRHSLLSSLFSQAGKRGTPISAQSRARADLLIAAIRSKGKISLNTLTENPRIARHSSGAEDVLLLGREQILVGDGEESALGGRSYHSRERGTLLDGLVALLKRYGNENDTARVGEAFEELLAGEEIVVARSRDVLNDFQFRAASPIHTAAELRSRTLSILHNPEVRRLLSISKSGYWLTKDWVREAVAYRDRKGFPPLSCEVITIRPDEVPPLVSGRVDVHKFAIPLAASKTSPLGYLAVHWWEHNRHLTLGLAGDDAATSPPVAGIYFLRRQNNPRIHPVFVDDPVDTATLQHIFWRYRMKHFRRRVFVAALEESSRDVVLDLLDVALAASSSDVQEHFRGVDVGKLLDNESDSAVLGAFVRGSVVESDDLVGVLAFTNVHYKHQPVFERTVRLDVVAVLPEWRKCGIGPLLMEALEDRVTQHGGYTVIVTADAASSIVMRDSFLASQGYFERPNVPGSFSKRLSPYFLRR
jgi:ribosomal protein S18 acetylase RimI-like enzyme